MTQARTAHSRSWPPRRDRGALDARDRWQPPEPVLFTQASTMLQALYRAADVAVCGHCVGIVSRVQHILYAAALVLLHGYCATCRSGSMREIRNYLRVMVVARNMVRRSDSCVSGAAMPGSHDVQPATTRRCAELACCARAVLSANLLLGRHGGAGPGLHAESASPTAAHVQLTCRRAQALCSPRRLVEARSRGAKPESPATASVPTASTWLMHLRHHGCVRGVCSQFSGTRFPRRTSGVRVGFEAWPRPIV